jgi:hypothetical protein
MQHQPENEKINSKTYWDKRFGIDWSENKGDEQSRFFASLAVGNLPEWFRQSLKYRPASFCDWGCALGDGTDFVRQALSLTDIAGIDFSIAAIETATSKYPKIRFTATDLLTDDHFPGFDIIFSSNTLEHFENPWGILDKLAHFAKKHLVILIPFEEYNRHFEHFYSFDTRNIPLIAGSSHVLSYAATIDASLYSPTYWQGKQILLIYSSTKEVGELALHLADLAIPSSHQVEFHQKLINDQNSLVQTISTTVMEIVSEQKLIVRQQDEQNAFFAGLQNKITGVEQSLSQVNEEVAKIVIESQLISQLKAENEVLRNSQYKNETQIAEMELEYNQVLAEKAALQERARQLTADLDDIRSSRYWKAGSPVRKIYHYLRGRSER